MTGDEFNVLAKLLLQVDPNQAASAVTTLLDEVNANLAANAKKAEKAGEKVGAAFTAGQAKAMGAEATEKVLREQQKRHEKLQAEYLKANLRQQEIALKRLADAAAAADRQALEDRKAAHIKQHEEAKLFHREALQELEHALKSERRLANEALWKQLEQDRIEHKLLLEQRRALDSQNLALTKSFLADLARLEQAEYREGARQAAEDGQKRLIRERAEYREGERLRKEAARAAAVQRKADLAEGARAERERASKEIQATRIAAAEKLAVQRAESAKALEADRAANRSIYVEEQAAEARRTARTRAFLRVLTATYESGLRGVQSLWSSHLRRREERQRSASAKELEVTKATLNRETEAIRAKLNERGEVYSRAARRQLARIEQEAAKETRVITAAQVRQAEAQQAIQRRTSTGIIGAATGRSSAGIGVQQLLAYAGGGLLLRSIYGEATEAIKTQKQTAAVLKSTGGAANVTAKQVDSLSNRLSVLAGVDDEAIAGAENLLLTFTNIRNIGKDRIFDRATESVLNMSVALKQDLKSSAIQIGKALNDPVKGITALRRVGVSFTKEQVDQIKVLVASGHTLDAQKMILRELQREFGGSARAAATWGDRLKVVVKNIEEAIGTALYPTISKVFGGVATLLQNLAFGKGAWKVIRDGLLGVAAGLAAILVAKGAVEVIGLAGKALAVLSSSPALIALTAFATLSGILFTLVRNSEPVRRFWKGLVDGTTAWIKVGYAIGKPVDGLSRIVRLQSSLGAGARIIHDFFASLVNGTVAWVKVGYAIGKPIDGLSRIVAAQSSIGAAARVIRDSFGKIREAFLLFATGNYSGASSILKSVVANVGDALRPLGGLILDGLRAAVGVAARGVGGFLQGAFGTGGFIGRLIGETPVSEAAAAVGERVRAVVRAVAANISGFIGGAVGGASLIERIVAGGGDATAAQKVGARLHEVLAKALSGAGRVFSALGGVISHLFSAYVLPGLVELPRILGRFLARTLFSRQFLTVLTRGAAGLAAIAAIVSVQFVRGFAEGLWQRRGDIASVVGDILRFAVKTIFGSGNPFLLISGALVAAFAAGKVIGAIDKLRGIFRIAAAGMTGDLGKTRDAVRNMRSEVDAIQGPHARVANGFLAIGRAVEKGRGAASFVADLGNKVSRTGERILKMEGLAVNAAGKVYDKATGRLAADPTKNMSRLRVMLGQSLVNIGDSVSQFQARMGVGWEMFKDKAKAAFQKVKDNAGAIAEATAGLVTGYFAGMADDAQTKALSIIGSIGSVAAAYATGGPVAAAVTGVATVIGYVYGASRREAEKARAEAKRVADAYKAAAKEAGDSFFATFKEQGNTSGDARSAAVSDFLKSQTEKNVGGIKQFLGKFQGNFRQASIAAGRSTKAIQGYLDSLVNTQLRRLTAGSKDSLGNFRREVRDAASATEDYLRITTVRTGNDAPGTLRGIKDASRDLADGKVNVKQYANELRDLGIKTKTVNEALALYRSTLEDNLRSSSGGTIISVIGRQLRDAIEKYRIYKIAQDQANQDAEKSAGFADRIKGAWDRISDSISGATDKVRAFFDAQSGKERTALELRRDILGQARTATSSSSPVGATDRRLAVLDAASSTSEMLARLAKGATSVDDLRSKVDAYFTDLGKGQGNKVRGFLAQVRNEITDEALRVAFDSSPAIKNVAELTTKLRDYLAQNAPDLLGKIDSEKDPKRRLDLLRVAMAKFQSEDHTVSVYVKKSASFDSVLRGIRRALGEPVAIPVTLDPLSISQPSKPGSSIPGTRNVDAYAGRGHALGGLFYREHAARIAEGGRPEAVFPLTNQPRMREIAAIPQVRSALATALPGPSWANSGAPTVVHNEVKVEQTIVEAAHPRTTAAEAARGIRKAQFLGGTTLHHMGTRL